jgi:multiple sugar transport system permease protein
MFGVFLIRQSFTAVPRELTEAAEIDGSSKLNTIFRIMVPLAKESIITFLLLQFTWVWNDYQGPLLWISSKDNYTVTFALAILRSVSDSGTPVLMAGSVLSLIPVVLLVVFFQKYFEKSVISAGIKG